MLKDGALELMKNESSEDGNAATAGSLEESWAKQDEEAFVASLAESDIKAIRSLWGAGASIVGAAQKAVDMRLVDLGHQYVEENRTKCRDPAGVFSLAGKANREMCVAFADMFGDRLEEVMEWAHTFGWNWLAVQSMKVEEME